MKEQIGYFVVGEGINGELKLGDEFEDVHGYNADYWRENGYSLVPIYADRKYIVETYNENYKKLKKITRKAEKKADKKDWNSKTYQEQIDFNHIIELSGFKPKKVTAKRPTLEVKNELD